MKSSIVAVIPARMESSRFPGKPLEKICGLPMVLHCLKRVQLCPEISEVIVATCNQEIVDAVESVGGRAIMTANTHVRCTDRIVEAVTKLNYLPSAVVLVQGDEPMIEPSMVSEAVRPLIANKNILCTNLVAPILDDEEFFSSNTIKVVVNRNFDVLYMSRQPIPHSALDLQEQRFRLKQVCIMGFRPEILEKFAALEPTAYETLESIDMNRLIEHGISVRAVRTAFQTYAVDTPADLRRVEALMVKDETLKRYL